MRISAKQLIFARVEPAASRAKERGWQTIYHSPQLTKEQTDAIVEHVQCFNCGQPGDGLERLQYFTLDDGSAVLTRSIAVADNVLIERSNRPGTFLAHCLVISPVDYRRIRWNPFVALDSFENEFLSTPTDLMERFVNPETPQAIVEFPVYHSHEGDGELTPEQIKTICRLGYEAQERQRRGEGVHMKGTPAQTADCLREMMRLLRPQHRQYCTFSTHEDRCNTPPGRYWAIGAGTPTVRGYETLDLNNVPPLGESLPQSRDGPSLFLNWVNFAFENLTLAEIRDRAATIEALAEVFEQNGSSSTDLNAEACADFKRLNPELVSQTVRTFLCNDLTEEAATRFLARLFAHRSDAEITKIAANPAGELPRKKLALELRKWIEENKLKGEKSSLARKDWKSLIQLAESVGDWRLLHLALTLDDSWFQFGASQRQQAALNQMTPQEYQESLKLTTAGVTPEKFVCRAHIGTLVVALDEETFSTADFIATLKTMMNLDGPLPNLNRLANKLGKLTKRQITTLVKLAKARVSRQPSDDSRRILALLQQLLETKSNPSNSDSSSLDQSPMDSSSENNSTHNP